MSDVEKKVEKLVESLGRIINSGRYFPKEKEEAKRFILDWLRAEGPFHFFPTRDELIRCGYKPCMAEGCQEVVLGDQHCFKHVPPSDEPYEPWW